MGWVHRQGLIRHRGLAVNAEGLGRSKEKGLLPKEIAAGSRKRYYKGRTEEDVAEILDYYFSLDLRGARPLLP